MKASTENTKGRRWTIKREKDNPDGKLLEITLQKIKIILLRRTRILIGKRHAMESRTMWLKNERGRNAALVVTWTTTPGEHSVSQSWSLQPEHTKIGETLNNHLNQGLVESQCTNPLQHDKNNLQKLTYYDEKGHRKSGNYPIQKCHRCQCRIISKYFLSSDCKSLFITLSGESRADVTISLRRTGTLASRVLDLRSKQIPVILRASRK